MSTGPTDSRAVVPLSHEFPRNPAIGYASSLSDHALVELLMSVFDCRSHHVIRIRDNGLLSGFIWHLASLPTEELMDKLSDIFLLRKTKASGGILSYIRSLPRWDIVSTFVLAIDFGFIIWTCSTLLSKWESAFTMYSLAAVFLLGLPLSRIVGKMTNMANAILSVFITGGTVAGGAYLMYAS